MFMPTEIAQGLVRERIREVHEWVAAGRGRR